MNKIIRFLSPAVLTGLAIFFSSCPEGVDPEFDPPGAVKIIPYSGDSAPVEKGLRSSVGNESVIIEWEKLTSGETPIREYRIYRSLGLDSPFTQIGAVFENENPLFQDESIGLDTMYYYYIRAVDTRGKISPVDPYFHPDSVARYVAPIMVKRAANPFKPFSTDTNVTTKPYLSWCYPITDLPSQYIIKLARASSQIIWIAKINNRIFSAGCDESGDKEFLTFNNQSYNVPNDSLLASDPVTVQYTDPVWFQGSRLPKGNYAWRIESRWANPAYQSRSFWGSFTITKDFVYP